MGGESLRDQLERRLRPIVRREACLGAVRVAAAGLLLAACALLAWHALPVDSPSAFVTAGLVLLPLLIGVLWMALARRDFAAAAIRVDRRYQLKDGTLSAWRFAHLPQRHAIEQLQIERTLARLNEVRPAEVRPWVWPRLLPVTLVLWIGIGLLAMLADTPPASADKSTPTADPQLLAEAEALQEELAELERRIQELAKDQELGELEALQRQLPDLKEQIAALKDPQTDVRVALAQLSKLEMALKQQMKAAEFNLAAVDRHLKGLGESLDLSDAYSQAAEPLRQGKHEAAARELEKVAPESLPPEEARTLADELDRRARKMESDGQDRLGKAAREMAEGLRQQDAAKARRGAGQMAQMARAQGIRQKLAATLSSKLGSIAEAKVAVRGKGGSNSKNVSPTKSPSERYGKGVTGKAGSEQASRLAQGNLEKKNITGQQGQGPSERETMASQQARQQAKREYRDNYAKFRKMSEAVLNNEPLPMSHRQMIRRYFQAIRPED